MVLLKKVWKMIQFHCHINNLLITSDAIPIIISFPDGDYEYCSFLFEDLGGIIKNKYTVAINGFAGSIDYTDLNKFCDNLREKDIPFLIEEDRIYHANLYYTSRNSTNIT